MYVNGVWWQGVWQSMLVNRVILAFRILMGNDERVSWHLALSFRGASSSTTTLCRCRYTIVAIPVNRVWFRPHRTMSWVAPPDCYSHHRWRPLATVPGPTPPVGTATPGYGSVIIISPWSSFIDSQKVLKLCYGVSACDRGAQGVQVVYMCPILILWPRLCYLFSKEIILANLGFEHKTGQTRHG